MALKTFSGSTPDLWANTMASLRPSMLAATIIWLASLVTPPAPMSPVKATFAPMTFSKSEHWSKISCLPPTIIARVALIAPGSPPLTGASSISTPFAAH